MKTEFSQQFFDKYSYIKFHENPSSGGRDVPCGQTDGRTDIHDEANSRFSQFCERAQKLRDMCSSWHYKLYITALL